MSGTSERFVPPTAPVDQDHITVVYRGPSMLPTLKPGELLVVRPYRREPDMRIGDVVVFAVPHSEELVVHRITAVHQTGLITRGDNNAHADSHVLEPSAVVGRVVLAWDGRRYRVVGGGGLGRIKGSCARLCNTLVGSARNTLGGLFLRAARWGASRYLRRLHLSTRVVGFQNADRTDFVLMWRNRVIGRCNPETGDWKLSRFFGLFVDRETLPRGEELRRRGADQRPYRTDDT